MPKRNDIKKILIIGAGPIVIGQACEFDYSGTQAVRALKSEGYEVILINSNPATIMTDPDLADKTYIEPITPEIVTQIIAKERPDVLLPTMGGQTALNIAVALSDSGVLKQYNVELIGAKLPAIKLAEDRELFKQVIANLGLNSPQSYTVDNYNQAIEAADAIGFPVILRPAFTLGGSGGGIANTQDEFNNMIRQALSESPTNQVLIEESLQGWKEFELEVVRDLQDNVAIICSIENLDPMGVHTGDSITVAPVQTLTDKEYQEFRNQAIAIIRAIGVESGGSNIQFAQNPDTGKIVVIEMNPRVSRSSALASKATGYPIAKIAAKLAIGYALHELPNEITKITSSAFEPSIDYVVTKIPRFAFNKFIGSEDILNTQMKSVGEVMAIGRTFQESFDKALRGLELGWQGFGAFEPNEHISKQELLLNIAKPSSSRIKNIWHLFNKQASVDEIHNASKIDKWFLTHMEELFHKNNQENPEYRGSRQRNYKMIDTCAGEIQSQTPYYYSTVQAGANEAQESQDNTKEKVIIIGGGPNRIGQGIEFDYCCVHASMILQQYGYETIMINSNPETVSTDFDISDRLYFEPITVDDVLAIYNQENINNQVKGVIIQLGGQTPLNIAQGLSEQGVNILGTPVAEINRAENRDEFAQIINQINTNQEYKLYQTDNGIAYTYNNVLEKAATIGYPVLVRPSFVIGGQAMQIIYNATELKSWLSLVNHEDSGVIFPILIDKFLDNAIEVDVDAISDQHEVIIAGIMEHVERAGIHSGDSCCVFPSQSLDQDILDQLVYFTKAFAQELKVQGLINIQFAIKDNKVYIIEVNPRASRTVPFISKINNIPWAKLGTLVMAGHKLSDLKIDFPALNKYNVLDFAQYNIIGVKEAVLPFKKFTGCNIALGPEMKSTGEVMGIDNTFGLAFAKAQLGANPKLNFNKTKIFLSADTETLEQTLIIARKLIKLNYQIYSTKLTHNYLADNNINTILVRDALGSKPNIINHLMDNSINILINLETNNTEALRRIAILMDLLLVTTIAGAIATVEALESLRSNNNQLQIRSLQELPKILNL